MRIKGKITSWKDEKGFGFITPNGGGKQIFVHIKDFNTRTKTLALNQMVTYTDSTDIQGRPRAVKVTRAGELLSKISEKGNNTLNLFIPILFVIFVGLSVFTNKIEFLVLPFYLALSLFTFILYAVDKSAAKNDSWRTPEKTLHLFSLACGWPGAMIAQQTLRHKSKKRSFRTKFWITVVMNVGGFIWLHTPEGVVVLSSIVDSGTQFLTTLSNRLLAL